MEEQPDYSIFPEKRVTYASFGVRLGAAIIDMLVVGVPLAIVFRVVYDDHISFYFFRYSFSNSEDTIKSFMQIVVGWLYSSIMLSSPLKATIGKRAVGANVTNMDGGRITFIQATGRHFGKILSLLTLLVGYFMMLWDKKNQTLHDKMAGTLVTAW